MKKHIVLQVGHTKIHHLKMEFKTENGEVDWKDNPHCASFFHPGETKEGRGEQHPTRHHRSPVSLVKLIRSGEIRARVEVGRGPRSLARRTPSASTPKKISQKKSKEEEE
jgi:hypothetical protein